MVAPRKKKGDKLELGGRDSNEKDHAKKGGGRAQRYLVYVKKNSASNIVCVVGSGTWQWKSRLGPSIIVVSTCRY